MTSRTLDVVAVCLAQVSRSELHAACPMPFDEGRLWRGEQGPALLGRMQATFRNITRIMDCVGCEKCKLWGKLQTLGERCAWVCFAIWVMVRGAPGQPVNGALKEHPI
jgi:hypothetical protein